MQIENQGEQQRPHSDETFAELEKDFRVSPPPPTLKSISIENLLQYDCKPREFILSPIIATQSLAMVHACRGVGKTFVALNIAYAVASGGEFLGWKAPKSRGVLFIDGEMPCHALKERMSKITESSDKKTIAPLNFITPDIQEFCMPDLATKEGQQQLEQFITEEIEIIVVDNISTLVRSGRENEAESWQPIQDWALQLRAKGKSILFIHHSNKNGKQRGSSRKEDVLDTVINLRNPIGYQAGQGALFEVHFEKARHLHGTDVTPFEAQLAADDNGKQCWAIKSLAQSNCEKITQLYNDGLSQKEICEELGIHKSNVSRHLKNAGEKGLVTRREKDD